MKFRTLQENLRKVLWDRIAEGQLTGLQLAQQTGFQQAHISNFLNRKRGLSLEGMDKVLQVQRLSVLDLLDPAEINKRASIAPPSEDDFENVIVVEGSVAVNDSIVMDMSVSGILKFKKTFLRKLRPEIEGDRRHWNRFVVVKADSRQGMSMFPRVLPGATVLLDRHYNSLKPYRRGETNMYGVNNNGHFSLKYVESTGTHLVLRPQNPAFPVELLAIDAPKKPCDYLIGRVSYVGNET
jgi:hypothetical protein